MAPFWSFPPLLNVLFLPLHTSHYLNGNGVGGRKRILHQSIFFPLSAPLRCSKASIHNGTGKPWMNKTYSLLVIPSIWEPSYNAFESALSANSCFRQTLRKRCWRPQWEGSDLAQKLPQFCSREAPPGEEKPHLPGPVPFLPFFLSCIVRIVGTLLKGK